jgi:hypothetical protein
MVKITLAVCLIACIVGGAAIAGQQVTLYRDTQGSNSFQSDANRYIAVQTAADVAASTSQRQTAHWYGSAADFYTSYMPGTWRAYGSARKLHKHRHKHLQQVAKYAIPHIGGHIDRPEARENILGDVRVNTFGERFDAADCVRYPAPCR